MAFLTFRDLPIYLSTAGLPSEGENNSTMVHATQGQFNYTPNLQQNRLLGQQAASKNNFVVAGPPAATLSFSAYLKNGEFEPNDFTGNNPIHFRIGDAAGDELRGRNMYLSSYSYSIAPYQPILVNAEFAIYERPSGQMAAETTNGPAPTSIGTYAHSVYSTVGAAAQVSATLLESVQYQFQTTRLPIYQIGSKAPSEVKQLSAEQSCTIVGDQIDLIIAETGKAVTSFDITLNNSTPAEVMKNTINGQMIAENVSISAGDIARGTVTISEPLI